MLVVSNAGPSDAQNVILTDNISPILTGVEFSVDGGATWNPWTGSYNIGTLASGSFRTILIRGTVNPSATGSIINTANVNSTTPDSNPDNNTSTIETEISTGPSADISVIKTASPNPVAAGSLLTYTVVVSNAGPSEAENVVLTDNVSPILTGVEFSIDGGITWNPWTGSYNIGTLTDGASRTILIRGTVNPSATGSIVNTAIVSSTTPDPNPNNNTWTITTGISTATSADISVVKTATPTSVKVGDLLTYTIVVSNAGPSNAENVIVIDNVSSSLTGVEFSIDGGLTWNPWTGSYNIGILANGVSRTILIRGIVNSTASGCIANAANVISTTPDPNLLNNISTICVEFNECADVSVVKRGFISCKKIRNILTYIITVSNAGPVDAQNVVLEDNLPSGVSGARFSIDGGVTWNIWTGSYNIGTLNVGSSITIIIESMINSLYAKEIINTARVSSTTCDPDLRNNTSTVILRFNPDNNYNGCRRPCNNMGNYMKDSCYKYMKDDYYK